MPDYPGENFPACRSPSPGSLCPSRDVTITPLSLFYKRPGGILFRFRDFPIVFARHKRIGLCYPGVYGVVLPLTAIRQKSKTRKIADTADRIQSIISFLENAA